MIEFNSERSKEFELYLRETCVGLSNGECLEEIFYLRIACSVRNPNLTYVVREFLEDFDLVKFILTSFHNKKYFELVEALRLVRENPHLVDKKTVFNCLSKLVPIPVFHKIETPKNMLEYLLDICHVEEEDFIKRKYMSVSF